MATEALAGLWSLVPNASWVRAIVRWSNSNDSEGVLQRATGVLANLATDDKYSREVACVGGVHALEPLLRNDTAPSSKTRREFSKLLCYYFILSLMLSSKKLRVCCGAHLMTKETVMKLLQLVECRH